MESLDLIARENEFKKLNKQLEKKTEKLMKEIEHVMDKQDIFPDFPNSLILNSSYRKISNKHNCGSTKQVNVEDFKEKNQNNLDLKITSSSNENLEDSIVNNVSKPFDKVVCDFCSMSSSNKNADSEFLQAFATMCVKENILPKHFSKGRITVEQVCKSLFSKIRLLQEKIDKIQNIIDKKTGQCEKHLTQIAEMESERLSLLNMTNNAKAEVADLRAKYGASTNRLNEKDRLYKEQRSECDKLTAEAKRLRSKNANLEARSAAQEDAVDKLRHQLDAAKAQEKESRDSSRALSASHASAVSRLQAQHSALEVRAAAQERLVQNLRSQRTMLLADAASALLEQDYAQFLAQD